MTNSIHSAYVSEGAKQILERWEAERAAGKYNYAIKNNNGLEKDVLVKSENAQAAEEKSGKTDSLKDKITGASSFFDSPKKVAMAVIGTIATGALLIATKKGVQKIYGKIKNKMFPDKNAQSTASTHANKTGNNVENIATKDIEVIQPEVKQTKPNKLTSNDDIIDAEFKEI